MLGGCASKGLCCGIFGGGGRKEGGPRRQRLGNLDSQRQGLPRRTRTSADRKELKHSPRFEYSIKSWKLMSRRMAQLPIMLERRGLFGIAFSFHGARKVVAVSCPGVGGSKPAVRPRLAGGDSERGQILHQPWRPQACGARALPSDAPTAASTRRVKCFLGSVHAAAAESCRSIRPA